MCIPQLAVIWTCYRVFPIVMQDETICRRLLELILGKKIGAVRFDDETTFDEISMEKILMKGVALKAVKLDVFATDELAWYNVEMLCYVDKELPKRSRMYQAEIDSDKLKGGQSYSELRDSYIIFISAAEKQSTVSDTEKMKRKTCILKTERIKYT